MTRDEIITSLREGRVEWQSLADGIPLDRMLEPISGSPWTVKDEIAHVTYYDRWTAGMLAALGRGEKAAHGELYDHPEPMATYAGDIDAFNEIIRERYAPMSAPDVVAANHAAFADLTSAVEALPAGMWAEPQDFTSGHVLGAIMAGQTWGHYAKHVPPLRRFREDNGL
jgi:hypothetical protein